MYAIFYNLTMILSLLVSLCVAGLAWQRRNAPGGRTMVAMAAGTFVWTLGFFLESRSGTLDRQLLFNNIGYFGAMSVPLTWFVFTRSYTQGGQAGDMVGNSTAERHSADRCGLSLD